LLHVEKKPVGGRSRLRRPCPVTVPMFTLSPSRQRVNAECDELPGVRYANVVARWPRCYCNEVRADAAARKLAIFCDEKLTTLTATFDVTASIRSADRPHCVVCTWSNSQGMDSPNL
jgi:hypothetical protein